MKILVSGANGFVGTNLRRHLEERGHACLKLDVSHADFGWNELEKIPWSEIGAVVHLAGKAHDLKKVSSEQSYFDVNVGLTERLFAALCEARRKTNGEGGGGEAVTRFIYFSSFKADAKGNAYGRSKMAAEQSLAKACSLFPDPTSLQIVVLRPAMIHGPGNKGNLNLLWGLARRGLPWPLAAFENRRSFTSIGNICAAVETLAVRGVTVSASSRPPSAPFIFGVADDEMLSTNRLIELIAETCGRKARLWRLPKGLMRVAAKFGDILHLPLNTERIEKLTEDSFVDNAALKQAIGWDRMPIRAEDGMRRTFESFRAVSLR